MNTRSLVVERVVNHPPEKVWRALTVGSLIERWLMANDFQPIVGHRFQLRTTPNPGLLIVIDAEVLTVEPTTRLAYRWDASSDRLAAPELSTVVTWTLETVNDGTLVRMEQSGFRADQTQAFKGAQYGWQRFLERLEQVVSTLEDPTAP
jgi:uncharacterized protein YndB with AHSA1/START domain